MAMRYIEHEGRTVNTNFGTPLPHESRMVERKTMRYIGSRMGEGESDLFDRLFKMGYTTIRLVYTTTNVSGWHQLGAWVK